MRCPACGAEAVAEAGFCHRCGASLETASGESAVGAAATSADASRPRERFEHNFADRRDDQELPEQELWRGGYSPKAMLGGWIVAGLISIAALLGGIYWARATALWWLGVLVAMLLPWLYCASVLAYRRLNVRYRLTSQRFLHERGILRRVNDRIEAIDMDDIAFEQGLLERLVGVGTIRITSSDRSHPDMVLPGIENVQRVVELFDDARRSERRRRGLHIEQV